MDTATETRNHREPWNKGKLVGQKAPFKLKDIWALRVRLQMEGRARELALLNLGIDSKLRGCDQVASRAVVMQHKTQRPVQFEITEPTRAALRAWIRQAMLKPDDFLFPSRLHHSPHLGTQQYARIVGHWVDELGLDRAAQVVDRRVSSSVGFRDFVAAGGRRVSDLPRRPLLPDQSSHSFKGCATPQWLHRIIQAGGAASSSGIRVG